MDVARFCVRVYDIMSIRDRGRGRVDVIVVEA